MKTNDLNTTHHSPLTFPMTGSRIAIIILILVVAVATVFFLFRFRNEDRPTLLPITQGSMNFSSPAFGNGQLIPSAYTCDGADERPPFAINGVPENAKSLAIIVDDPDASAGDWVHWLAWNIDPTVSKIEGTLPPDAVEGTTDFKRTGWGGPCPPSGVHRYQFKLYALDDPIDLDKSAKKADLERAMQGHVIEGAAFVGKYARVE
jgi:Raf kinase inhibitor-like YbhB/YbcL family protein